MKASTPEIRPLLCWLLLSDIIRFPPLPLPPPTRPSSLYSPRPHFSPAGSKEASTISSFDVRRRLACIGMATLLGASAGLAVGKSQNYAVAREVEVNSYLPASQDNPHFVQFKASSKDSLALLGGNWHFQSSGSGLGFPSPRRTHKTNKNGRWVAARAVAIAAAAAPAVATPAVASDQVRPSPAEAARTIVDICTEGTLSMLSEDEWPTATAIRFALDAEGNPVFRFSPLALHTRNLAADNRSSLHVQLEQPGRRRPQCTLRGRIQKIDDPTHVLKLDIAWERRFGQERVQEDEFYIMNVEQALHAQDMGEEEIWVSGSDFSAAVADPLRDCAPRIVEDMNRKHWEDVRRFCKSHARLDVEVEEASMTWVDRLGFDLRVLTRSPQAFLEVRIPFSRAVSDERDARSSLTMMAQIAWEHERNYSPPDVQLLGSFNV